MKMKYIYTIVILGAITGALVTSIPNIVKHGDDQTQDTELGYQILEKESNIIQLEGNPYKESNFKYDNFEGSDGSVLKVNNHIPTDLTDKYPLIVYLHDTPYSSNDEYVVDCLMSYMHNEQEEAHVLVPFITESEAWTGNVNQVVYELIDSYKDEPSVDKRRIYAFGIGQGANGLLQLALGHPDLLSSMILISCGPNTGYQCDIPAIPESIKGLNIWAVNSYDDRSINQEYMREMMLAFSVKNFMYSHYAELFGGGHEVKFLFNRYYMWDWLFNSRRVE